MKNSLLLLLLLLFTAGAQAVDLAYVERIRAQTVACQNEIYYQQELLSYTEHGTLSPYLSNWPLGPSASSEEVTTELKRRIDDDHTACERRLAQARLPVPRLGMTMKQVREKTNWGVPDRVNRTVTTRINHEQWIYEGSGYLYFEDGILVGFQD